MNPKPLVIDLSHHNTVRDLGFAYDAGIRAAIIKCTQGVGGRDAAYTAHALKAENAGLEVGAYHFGTGQQPGVAQARYMLKTLEGDGGIPQVLVLDVEENPSGTTMSLAQAEAFVNEIRISHPISTVVVYGGSMLREMKVPKSSVLLTCPLWLADYSPPPSIIAPWPSWMLWQFTDKKGSNPSAVDALDGYDLSSAFDDEVTIKHLWNLT